MKLIHVTHLKKCPEFHYICCLFEGGLSSSSECYKLLFKDLRMRSAFLELERYN